MQMLSTQDLSNGEFIKIRWTGYAIFFIFTRPKTDNDRSFTLRRETKLDNFTRCLEDERWRGDYVGCLISNCIIDARQKLDGDDGIL